MNGGTEVILVWTFVGVLWILARHIGYKEGFKDGYEQGTKDHERTERKDSNENRYNIL